MTDVVTDANSNKVCIYIYIMVLCIVCRVSFMVMPGYLGNRLFNM